MNPANSNHRSSQKHLKKLILRILLLAALCCIPLRFAYKDGGTVRYQAMLYAYVSYHKQMPDDSYDTTKVFLPFPLNFVPGIAEEIRLKMKEEAS